MDPLSKRRVWTMIEQLKADRVMLLTTHSMEEADALGDKVAILDKGRLRAVGSSLFLKRTYGKGHTISLLSDVEAVPQIEQIIKTSIPSAEILGSDAGSTSVSIKRSAVQGIPRLFTALMAKDGLVKEWGISDTTLEEVFLRLAAQSKEVNAEIEGQQDDDSVGTVILVRQPPQGASSEPELVCLLEAKNPSTIAIVGPDNSGLSIVPEGIGSPEGSQKRYQCVADGGAILRAGPEMTSDKCGILKQYDEVVVLEEFTLPNGVLRVHCDKGWISLTAGDGSVILKVLDADAVLTMDELRIPSSIIAAPTVQMVDMVVPIDSQPGQQVLIEIGGEKISVSIPTDAQPGSSIQIPVPLPQVQSSELQMTIEGLDNAFGANHIPPVSIAHQTYAVVWKNAVLAFGCRRAPGFKGCLNCKCVELFCYISLFVVMALVAVVHMWILTFVEGMERQAMEMGVDRFCFDGVSHVVFERGFGWAPGEADPDDRYNYGSYCPCKFKGDLPLLAIDRSFLTDCL